MKLIHKFFQKKTINPKNFDDHKIEYLYPNNEYFVQCNNNSKTFINTTSFSNGLNSFTGEYFGATSISRNDNIIVFDGVYSIRYKNKYNN